MLNAVGYIRRSAKSEGNTISLEEQEQQIRKYCNDKNINCASIVRHDGVSGTKRSRFDEIEKAIREYRANTLLVYNVDRLARDVSGLLDVLRDLHKRGIPVVEVSSRRVLDLSKSDGFILTAVKGAFDELYPLIIGEKTRDALARKKATGQQYSHIPPFGYAYAEGRLVIEPEEQRALSLILECQQEGLSERKTIEKVRSAQYLGRLSRKVVARYRLGPPGNPSIP